MDNRRINEEYTAIGMELINTEPDLAYIKNSEASIIFLESDSEKSKGGNFILGQCEKVQSKHKWAIPCDFTITVFTPNIQGFTDEQIRVLLFHELLHVGIEKKSDNTEMYFINPHDLEDFRLIINKFGANWDSRARC